jgi:hypothetical protein
LSESPPLSRALLLDLFLDPVLTTFHPAPLATPTHPNTTPEQPLKSGNLADFMSPGDVEFLKSIEMELLFEVILGANYLNIPHLLDVCCAKVAAAVRNKSVADLRKEFHVKNDFSAQEETLVADEQKWLEES